MLELALFLSGHGQATQQRGMAESFQVLESPANFDYQDGADLHLSSKDPSSFFGTEGLIVFLAINVEPQHDLAAVILTFEYRQVDF